MQTRTTLAAVTVLAVSALLGYLAASGRLAMIAQAQDKSSATHSTGGSEVLPRLEPPFKGKIGPRLKNPHQTFPRQRDLPAHTQEKEEHLQPG